jgi:hypothetical protein
VTLTARGTPKFRFTRDWTTREVEYLRSRAGLDSAEAIGKVLNRSAAAVCAFAMRYEIRLQRRGERHQGARFTDAQIRAARDMAARGVKQRLIANGCGISEQHVSHIIKRRSRA